MEQPRPDMAPLKSKLRATWMAGDFGQIAKSYERGAAEYVARLDLRPGMRVLDVACGTGNLALPAARAGASVTGVDIAPNVLDAGRARANAEGLTIQFDEGDAEDMSYPDGAFDVVVTMFGAMFAPQPEKAARELTRVCRPGGLVAMANWAPAGFIGQMFKTTSTYVPPPPGIAPPVLWGDEATVQQRLDGKLAELRFQRRFMTFTFPFAVPEVVEFWRQYYGPTQRTFDALEADTQAAYRRDLERLWSEHNRATDGTTRVESEYLEVQAIRA
ncbi:MAG: class I SAM-dependent methyltransferase [Candidatus Riflebacteria bacterium]|nr:class I SAM-dependent methyltransferase [Candidatus Riflebacteria bacterium]